MSLDTGLVRLASWMKSKSDAEWRALTHSVKGVIVVSILFVGLHLANSPLWKSLIVCTAAFVMYLAKFGSRRLDQLGMLIVALLLVEWLELLPVHRWISGAVAVVDRFLTSG